VGLTSHPAARDTLRFIHLGLPHENVYNFPVGRSPDKTDTNSKYMRAFGATSIPTAPMTPQQGKTKEC
jgi:hypothetical protein